MRRLIGIALLGLALPLVLVFGLGASGDGGSGYEVRAIFDYVRATPGEDVKVAGARVGSIDSLDVTKQKKAAVVLKIERAGFTPFHADAHCTIRPQSLIGETFVECDPGTSRAPELGKVPDGEPGAGQHLLPVERTSSPVDIDLINDVMRLPIRQRLAILVNEFGTALAGRGNDLNTVIHRANPALRDTDRVLAVLARQSHTLASLAQDSDRVLGPLAARRQRVADFVVQANRTAQATAQRRADISGSIRRLPAFLRQLRPTLQDLGGLSDEMTPVLADLHDAAPGINRLILQLGPFSRASVPALKSLGQAADVGGPALKASRPLLIDLRRFAVNAGPVSKNLDALSQSLDKTGGIERVMDYIFFQMAGINGFDGISHYLRAGLIVNLCSTYAITPTVGCNANFRDTKAVKAASGPSDPTLAKEQAALRAALAGKTPAAGAGNMAGSASRQPSLAKRFLQFADPTLKRKRDAGIRRIRQRATQPSPALDTGDPAQPALDYLLGNDG